MTKPDFALEFIKDPSRLSSVCTDLLKTPAFALDIETVEWWNRRRERVSLVQIAFRRENQFKVAVIDALVGFDLELLRAPLEMGSILKIIHNANFDAARLSAHYDFTVSPIHDTMLAARRAGERKYSLKAQAAKHLNLSLDKSVRLSDWRRRPLDSRQLYYAALDPYATLLLYENQTERNLNGAYYSQKASSASRQGLLPLDDAGQNEIILPPTVASAEDAGMNMPEQELHAIAAAILGIVVELPSRYGPEQLSVSLGAEQRVGVAGWIADSRLGRDAELDEETVRLTIASLCERGFLRITETRRLEATEMGADIWRRLKSN